ncbi:hypothetical protein DDB_G0286595 [Dictyostelium discoideum AX4]|uniref:EGF-like domain-containing protein n=1 Tax=Dictyostelium discoideum TaxID=44689 RepID=Q54LK6_DICDI|nr:hypothetical protein DDB_G0286595 [Dictyostelium discoideum AX4]EAL64053.1 hypothetical protein DDB_G0286595 [Dictyostelium discoideum AX4]|eukprot:XP_637555.1 hypothetical protein DDB_G0286595 [Dictyostelium discoideum AX4]
MVKIFVHLNKNNFVFSQCSSVSNYTNYGCSNIKNEQIQGVMCKSIGYSNSYVFTIQPKCPIITPTSPPIYAEIGRTNYYTIENGNLPVTNCYSNFYTTNIYNFGKNCLNSSDSFIKTVNYKIEKDLIIQSCSNNITYFIPNFNSSLLVLNETNGNGYCKQFGAINSYYSTFWYAEFKCPNCNYGKCVNNSKCLCDKAYQIDEFCRINFCDQPINPCVGNRTCDRVNADCYCSPGFKLNAKGDCIDIDECLISDGDFNNYTCPINFICNNKIGTYSCDCPFTLTNNNTNCIIITPTFPNLEPSKNSTTSFNLKSPNTELFENSKFKSLIIIKSLNELDFQDKIIKQYNLESILWSYNNQTINDTKQIETYFYNTTINSTSISKSLNKSTEIKVLFNWYKDIDSNVNNKIKFANQEIKIEPYSLKFNIEISSYSFESDLNTLKLIIQSQVDSQIENDCPTNSINIYNNLDNFKIKLNDRSLNCNFIKRGIVDGTITTLSNSYLFTNSTNLSIAINIPHYENLIQMDPSFSIFIDHTSSTNEQGCNNEKSREWVKITIGVVVGVVGSTIFIIVGFILYKRNQTNIKVGLNKLKKLGND